jgi:RNA polymerase sigma-70 factor (ECF subfamily)
MGDSDAQDVVQETMTSVFQDLRAGSYDPAKGSFKHWLLNCTRWRIRDWFRRKGVRVELESRRNLEPGTSTGTDTIERLADPAGAELDRVWDEEWENTMMEAAIQYAKRMCDPKDFQIFHYQVIKKHSISKVAKTFHLSRGRIYMARYRVGKVITKEIRRLSNELP